LRNEKRTERLGSVRRRTTRRRGITEHKRAEEAFRESEHKLKAVIYSPPIPQFVIDRNHTVTYWNKALEEITGIKAELVIGTNRHWSAFYSEERPCMADLLVDGRPEQIPELYGGKYGKSMLVADAYEATDYFSRMDKEGRWLYFTAAAIRDPEGNVTGAVETLEDVTDRKRAEEALRESEQRLRRITNSMLDMVVETDLHGVCKYASPSCKDIMGYDPKELVGNSLFDFIHPEDVGVVTETVQRAVTTGRLWTGGRFECRYRHADGHYVWLENLANIVYDEKGQMIGGVIGARDITERKRMEEKLRQYSSELEQIVAERTSKLAESELRFRKLADLLPQTVFECDEKGNLTFVNSNGLASLGYTEDEFRKGLNVFQMFVQEDSSRAMENFLRTQNGERVTGNEYSFLRKDGTTFSAIVFSSLILRENRPAGLRGILVDITERRQMEEQLRSAKERLDYVVTSNPAVIYSGKPRADLSDWDLTYLSEAVASLLGYESREFVGHPEFWANLIHPRDRSSVLTQIPLLWERGRSILEYRMLHKDGSYRWIREEAYVVRDTDGRPIEVNGYWTDISAQKQAELALSESERKYRQLVETAQEGLFTYDTNGMVTFVNPFLSTMLGYAPEEMVGKSLLLFVYGEDVSKVRAGMERRRRGIGDTYEVRLIRKNESRIHVSVSASPITGKDGEYAGGLALLTDITERKEMEQRLQQAEHLAAVGETAAMVGHDLRNPLQGIAGATYLLRQETLTGEERNELLQLIDDNVEYSDGIVKDLLDYSRTFELALSETTPKAIIACALREVKVPEKINVQNLSLEQPVIAVDLDRIKRALVNLVENAVDAMPDGGTLTISSRQSNGFVEIAFSDTGAGFSKEVLENLWKPLQTTKAKGMGMGLAICKRIVDAHRGSVSVHSKPGEGTTFIIRLPIKPEVVTKA